MKRTFINDGCLLDDTIHLSAWFFNRIRQQYHVVIFGNPFSDNYYMTIKCGYYLTKLNIRDFQPLTDFQTMHDFIKTTENRI